MSIPHAACIGFLVAAFIPGVAAAQTLSQIVPSLVNQNLFINDISAPPSVVNHRDHFFESGLDQRSLLAVTGINQGITAQLSALPLGSSSGSMTYAFDAALGSFTRSSESFGPSFAERPLTIGRKKFSVGFNVQHSSYESFQGKDLESSEMKFYFRHNNCCPAVNPGEFLEPPFEGDLAEVGIAMDVKTDMFSVFGNYGITDRLDVGFAVRIDLSASVTNTLVRLATEANPGIHRFSEEQIRQFPGSDANMLRRSASGNHTGIGDTVLRTKLNLGQSPRGAWAVALDLRLPTGDEENLAGFGETQTKLYGIGAVNFGRVSPHVNAGYTFSTDDVADEVNYVVGFDASIVPRISVAADVIGRVLRDVGRFEELPLTFDYRTAPQGQLQNATFQQLQIREGNLHVAFGAVGFKVNVGSTFLVTTNILFQLTDAGLKSSVTPMFGFDYTF
jgi:Putative MetA-pathway of phenol degradation